MARWLLSCLLFVSFSANAQTDTTKWVRAFPITDYIQHLNDSVVLVQINLPSGVSIAEKQMGVLKGVYNEEHTDTVQKGYGRCQLIKGDYYYFSIIKDNNQPEIMAGDLLYLIMDRSATYYGLIPKLASCFISLQNVYDQEFYDRYNVFTDWTKEREDEIIDLMVEDIRFTGNYFLENDSSMNEEINEGAFKGKYVLQVMTECTSDQTRDFIKYVIARPRLYAGKEWKVSETFATWLSFGAPTVVGGDSLLLSVSIFQ